MIYLVIILVTLIVLGLGFEKDKETEEWSCDVWAAIVSIVAVVTVIVLGIQDLIKYLRC